MVCYKKIDLYFQLNDTSIYKKKKQVVLCERQFLYSPVYDLQQ